MNTRRTSPFWAIVLAVGVTLCLTGAVTFGVGRELSGSACSTSSAQLEPVIGNHEAVSTGIRDQGGAKVCVVRRTGHPTVVVPLSVWAYDGLASALLLPGALIVLTSASALVITRRRWTSP